MIPKMNCKISTVDRFKKMFLQDFIDVTMICPAWQQLQETVITVPPAPDQSHSKNNFPRHHRLRFMECDRTITPGYAPKVMEIR